MFGGRCSCELERTPACWALHRHRSGDSPPFAAERALRTTSWLSCGCTYHLSYILLYYWCYEATQKWHILALPQDQALLTPTSWGQPRPGPAQTRAGPPEPSDPAQRAAHTEPSDGWQTPKRAAGRWAMHPGLDIEAVHLPVNCRRGAVKFSPLNVSITVLWK